MSVSQGWYGAGRGLRVGLVCSGLGLWAGAQTPAPSVDFTALPPLFEVMEVLSSNREPSELQWERVFSTSGYQALRHEFPVARCKERFRLAWMPARRAALQEAVATGGKEALLLKHYQQARDRREALVTWMRTAKLEDRAARANARALQWVAGKSSARPPALAFVVFAPDARGYDPVVVDAVLAMPMGDSLDDLIAHECFHIHRNQQVRARGGFEGPGVLDQIHNEGIADLIDKTRLLGLAEDQLAGHERQFLRLVRETPAVIQAMDRLLAGHSGDSEALQQALRQVVPQSGHPTGFYMAKAILDAFGKEAVIAVSTDVLGFFRRYQEAARRPGASCPGFSPEALATLASFGRSNASKPHGG